LPTSSVYLRNVKVVFQCIFESAVLEEFLGSSFICSLASKEIVAVELSGTERLRGEGRYGEFAM